MLTIMILQDLQVKQIVYRIKISHFPGFQNSRMRNKQNFSVPYLIIYQQYRTNMKILLKQQREQIDSILKEQTSNIGRFYVSIGSKKYMVTENLLLASKLIQKKIVQKQYGVCINRGEKINMISVKDERIKSVQFQKVLACLEGDEICLIRNQEIMAIWNICEILRIESIQKLLLEDLQKYFEEYDVFLALSLSSTMKMSEIVKKCLHQLIKQEFEPMNFNRYELLQCEPEIFKRILKAHREFKQRNLKKGLSNGNIFEIVKQYSKIHKVSIDPFNYISKHLEVIKEQDHEDFSEKFQESNMKKKRNKFISMNISYSQTIYNSLDNSTSPCNSNSVQYSESQTSTESSDVQLNDL